MPINRIGIFCRVFLLMYIFLVSIFKIRASLLTSSGFLRILGSIAGWNFDLERCFELMINWATIPSIEAGCSSFLDHLGFPFWIHGIKFLRRMHPLSLENVALIIWPTLNIGASCTLFGIHILIKLVKGGTQTMTIFLQVHHVLGKGSELLHFHKMVSVHAL